MGITKPDFRIFLMSYYNHNLIDYCLIAGPIFTEAWSELLLFDVEFNWINFVLNSGPHRVHYFHSKHQMERLQS